MHKKIKGDNHREKEKPLSHYSNADHFTPVHRLHQCYSEAMAQ